jgi:hypothetical protein
MAFFKHTWNWSGIFLKLEIAMVFLKYAEIAVASIQLTLKKPRTQTPLTSQFLASSCIQVSLIQDAAYVYWLLSLLSPELIPLISCSVTVPNSPICSQCWISGWDASKTVSTSAPGSGCCRAAAEELLWLRLQVGALALAFWLLLKSQIENSREIYGIKPRFYISVVSVGVHLVVNHLCLSLVFKLGINYQNYTNAGEL